VEHARLYAARKGWIVADEHVYLDAGKYKLEGHKNAALTADSHAALPGRVNEAYDRFATGVAQGARRAGLKPSAPAMANAGPSMRTKRWRSA
jgi:hypothetical protein